MRDPTLQPLRRRNHRETLWPWKGGVVVGITLA
jgi:hypothetical protein